MDAKPFIWIGAIVGSTLGGFVPMLWHASWLSFSSIIFSGLGGVAGIWAGFRISQRM